jgi:hypothetical protein
MLPNESSKYEISFNSFRLSFKITDPFLIPSPTYTFGIDITFALPLKNLSADNNVSTYLLDLLPVLRKWIIFVSIIKLSS